MSWQAWNAKKPMKPMPMTRQTISTQCRLLAGSLSINRPTRIISPLRKVCARPRNAIAAMHQDTKSSAAGMFNPIGRPAESSIISTKIASMNGIHAGDFRADDAALGGAADRVEHPGGRRLRVLVHGGDGIPRPRAHLPQRRDDPGRPADRQAAGQEPALGRDR